MENLTVKLTKEVTPNQIADWITTALEGGSNYWYLIKEFPKQKEGFTRNEAIHYEWLDQILQGGRMPIFDVENPEDDALGVLTWESIKTGLEKLAKNDEDTLRNLLDDYDAGDADVFFQYCVLGEIVYG